jgi:NADH:quinone reductase (non-electrogenic)
VVVGAGYTGTEVAAQGAQLTAALVATRPHLRGSVRWMLLDLAPRVLPELDERLSRTADRVLRARGVEVRTGESVAEACADGVRLTGGEDVGTHTLVWCVGVRPDPLFAGLGLATERGRLVVDAHLRVPGHPEVVACGDAAGVPDLLSMPGNRLRVAADRLIDAVQPRQGVQLGLVRAAQVPLEGDAVPRSSRPTEVPTGAPRPS